MTEKWHSVMGNCRQLAEHCVAKIDQCELSCAKRETDKGQDACIVLCQEDSDKCEEMIIRCNVDRTDRGLESE